MKLQTGQGSRKGKRLRDLIPNSKSLASESAVIGSREKVAARSEV
jgi:hypothetical protein